MPTLPADDPAYELNFIRSGPHGGPTVILVHAVGLDLTYWESQIFALSERFDVVAYDLLGHGTSTAPLIRYDLGSLAADLAAVIHGVGVNAAHIVGLSVGGMIAQTLAVTKPDLVKSLSLIDTAATLSDQARVAIRQRAQITRQKGMGGILQQTIERWFTPEFATRRPEVIDRVGKTLLKNPSEVHAAFWDAIAELDVAPLLPTVHCPTLIMVGEKDPTTPVAASELIARQTPNTALHVLEGASHMSPIEAPTEVSGRLIDFLVEA